MSVQHHPVTVEEFSEMPGLPDKGFELVKGEVVEVSLTNIRHGLIATMLAGRLSDFVRKGNLGFVMGDNVGYVLRRNPDSLRSPDVSFLARDKASDLDRFAEGPPTIAVEVVSPNDRANDIQERVQDYLEAGTRLVWVLWPQRRAVSVYRPNADTRELDAVAELDGGDVLPGFSVRVGDLFEIQ